MTISSNTRYGDASKSRVAAKRLSGSRIIFYAMGLIGWGLALALAVTQRPVTADLETAALSSVRSVGYRQIIEPESARQLPQLDGLKQSPLTGFYQIPAGNQNLYITEDGRHAMLGDLINLTTGKNLTQTQRQREAYRALITVPDEYKLIYAADGVEKVAIEVMTDTDCPYCRRFHRDVPKLNAAGVTVKYLPFARAGVSGIAYKALKGIWCSEDPAAEMHAVVGGKNVSDHNAESSDCQRGKIIDTVLELGTQLEV